MDIEKITIVGGYGRSGEKEPVIDMSLKMRDVASIVGPTGSGITALINDIELFAGAYPYLNGRGKAVPPLRLRGGQ